MRVINKTTEEINTLLDKVEGMPEEGVVGKTPVLETGTTTTLPAGSNATSQVVANGTDSSGNPKYKLNFGIPKGQDGTSGGGGGVADSVDWSNVTNKPTWVNSATKPTYTATEVGALPATTTIPSKTSQLTNDSNFTTTSSFKTVNGQSIVGSGNIEISGTGGGIADAPSDGKTYGRKNGAWTSIESLGGSVDITDIINRLTELADVEGTCTDEDYNALKGYADNGIVTYIKIDSYSAITNVLYIDNYIKITVYEYSEYGDSLVVLVISTNKQVSLSPQNFYSAQYYGYGILGAYRKPSAYSAITKDDTITTAIGKLEAGLSSGGGSSDDVYYLNPNILKLKSTATVDEVKAALGGDGEITNLKNAIKSNKHIYVKYNESSITSYYANVDYTMILGGLWVLKIHHSGVSFIPITIIINNTFDISIIYDKGYTLNSEFYSLTNKSTTEEISTAIGGEDGMKELIKAVKDGNNIYISGDYLGNKLKTNLIPWGYKELENGDLVISFGTFGHMPWGSNNMYGFISIGYTKSSNTFAIQVI